MVEAANLDSELSFKLASELKTENVWDSLSDYTVADGALVFLDGFTKTATPSREKEKKTFREVNTAYAKSHSTDEIYKGQRTCQSRHGEPL